MRVAVIGSGISGNAAAWALCQPMAQIPIEEVVMYERSSQPGGHSHTVDIDYNGKTIPVDIGFIVYNTLNYPNLVALFQYLGVSTNQSSMSFAASMSGGELEWSGKSFDTIFAQKKNLVSLPFWNMLRDILRFNKMAPLDLAAGRLENRTLGDYLADNHMSRPFIDNYLAPMGCAIWSTPHTDILQFPAENFIRFFDNHRLMHPRKERPQWRTVSNGSRSYVSKMIAPFQENIRLNTEVSKVIRKAGMVHVIDQNGHEDIFDHVILASHTDQTLAMMDDASSRERDILSAIKYRSNTVYLHRDPAFMPKAHKVWSAWNYIETTDTLEHEAEVCVSYYMNLLQKIDSNHPLFVSLNPSTLPRDDLIFATNSFDHPQFSQQALDAQRQLPSIQGQGNIWYCGAWCGQGFHEDGLKAGFEVAEKLGARIPWREYDAFSPANLEAAE